MKRILTLLSICLFLFQITNAQKDSIYTSDGYRTYIVHLPSGYNSSNSYPLVLNFHGLGSNAAEQELYTGMDAIADTAKFIVVYPEGINKAWNLNVSTAPYDVNFASALIDSLKKDLSVDAGCVYSTGMSNGGFLSFLIGCYVSNKIAAIAPVAGNMPSAYQFLCSPVKGMPVLEIHGTSDATVPYAGQTGVPSVRTTINYWYNKDNCDTTAVKTTLPDSDPTDGCTVDVFTYVNGKDNSEVIHYRINGGGHTWPGPIPVSSLGNTCNDFNASGVIWTFFRKYCASKMTAIHELAENGFEIYPNPANDNMQIKFNSLNKNTSLQIFDVLGKKMMDQAISAENISLNVSSLAPGNYFIRLNGEKMIYKRFVKVD